MIGLQKKLLELLCEIDEICLKHDIDYALFAGSGLGAERHKGFIPWDDDADIVMTLDNYEKFIKVAPGEMMEGRTLNYLEQEGHDYMFTYARYIDTDTSFIQRHTAFGHCDPGIKIDIFVVVPTYADPVKAEKHKQKILAFGEAIAPYGVQYRLRDDAFYPLYHKEVKKLNRMGREKYVSKMLPKLKYAVKGNTGKYVMFSGTMMDSFIIDSRILDETVRVPFEDVMLPVSKYNIEFNRFHFGEGWMNIPPDGAKARHGITLMDGEISYERYLEKMKAMDDYDDLEKLAADYRANHLYDREEFRDVLNNRQKIANVIAEENLKLRHDEIMEKTDWRSIERSFLQYRKTQLAGRNKYYNFIVDIAPDLFEKGMEATIVMGGYPAVKKIIDIRKQAGVISQETYDRFSNYVEICVDLIQNTYLHEDKDKIRSLKEGLTDPIITESLPYMLADTWLAVQDNDEEKMREYLDNVSKHVEKFGKVGEIYQLQADCLTKLGQQEEADSIYSKIGNMMKNAIALQKLIDGGYYTYGK